LRNRQPRLARCNGFLPGPILRLGLQPAYHLLGRELSLARWREAAAEKTHGAFENHDRTFPAVKVQAYPPGDLFLQGPGAETPAQRIGNNSRGRGTSQHEEWIRPLIPIGVGGRQPEIRMRR